MTEPEYESYMEVWRITEWKDGAVYKTVFVEKRWVPMGAQREGDLMFVPISTSDPDSLNLNIRRKREAD